ncbi:MAG TPA: metalloregulator ArsR/SmtB family transcription factor [Bacteroidota bacterium]|jgi:ArsR family transcriptional regulator|nr:metalloregulator ArsR/SmtB family transcription factor [Bacteroidota bacterium]
MDDLLSLFSALADSSRLRILNLLFQTGELCVCDLEATLGFSQTKVSRHMDYLKRAGLVRNRRDGRWILYSIPKPVTHHRRLVITSLRRILASHARTHRDTLRLRRRIRDGCCATFTILNPD